MCSICLRLQDDYTSLYELVFVYVYSCTICIRYVYEVVSTQNSYTSTKKFSRAARGTVLYEYSSSFLYSSDAIVVISVANWGRKVPTPIDIFNPILVSINWGI